MKLQNMRTVDNDVSVCANCGTEGSSDNMNICNKCKQVKYCNAACKKKHRHKHKKDCEEHIRLATEQAAKLHDEKLFKQPPKEKDCSICFLQLPSLENGYRYMSCCGKVICCGCAYSPLYDNQGNEVDNDKCPFCRIPIPTSIEEAMKRYKRRIEANDPIAIYNQGNFYRDGRNGYPQDYKKALERFHRAAAELGNVAACTSCGYAYEKGEGVDSDEKKAVHYYELAAMGGSVQARYNLGKMEGSAGNFDRALKHWIIASGGGDHDSLQIIKRLYSEGFASKEDYMKALHSYQTYLGEIKSRKRDQAAAVNEDNRYY